MGDIKRVVIVIENQDGAVATIRSEGEVTFATVESVPVYETSALSGMFRGQVADVKEYHLTFGVTMKPAADTGHTYTYSTQEPFPEKPDGG